MATRSTKASAGSVQDTITAEKNVRTDFDTYEGRFNVSAANAYDFTKTDPKEGIEAVAKRDGQAPTREEVTIAERVFDGVSSLVDKGLLKSHADETTNTDIGNGTRPQIYSREINGGRDVEFYAVQMEKNPVAGRAVMDKAYFLFKIPNTKFSQDDMVSTQQWVEGVANEVLFSASKTASTTQANIPNRTPDYIDKVERARQTAISLDTNRARNEGASDDFFADRNRELNLSKVRQRQLAG